MKRLLLAILTVLAVCSAAAAQCNGGISGCPAASQANLTDLLVVSQVNPFSPGGSGYTTRKLTVQQLENLVSAASNPGGMLGQVQYNNNGVFGGFTVAGDGSLNTSTGSLVVNGTNGTPFAASATSDTTNAANIVSGVLPSPRLTGTYGTLTGTGTLTAGATGAGFTVNLGTSTVLGMLSVANGGTGAGTFTANLPLIGNGTGAIAQGTRSGTTTTFATASGSFTAGHCLQADGNINIVDAGSPCGGGGGGSGTVSSGLSGQMTYYASNGTAVMGNTNANISAGALTLGQANTALGSLILEGGTSGALTVAPQAVAGTPVWTAGTSSGTPAVTASAPLAIATATGNIACGTCATTTNGGAITGTAPIGVSAAGAISISPGTGLSIGAGNLNLSNTSVSPASYGSSTSIPSFTVNQQGQLTAAAGNAVVAPAGTLTGTTLAAGVVSSSLTSVGALASGSLAVGFTPVTGTLIATNTVANSNLAQMGAGTVKCNLTGGTANATDCTALPAAFKVACTSIAAYGGAGNNSTDNVTPLTNAYAALSGTGGCIYFPAGKYKFTTAVTFSFPAGIFSVTLTGDGQDNTILTWPNATHGLAFDYAGISSSVHLRDMSLTTAQAGGFDGIIFSQSASVVNVGIAATSDLYRVTLRGDSGYGGSEYWGIGLNMANVSGVQIDNLTIGGGTTQAGIGVQFIGLPGSSTYAVLLDIAKSNFFQLATGLVYGSFVQGVTVDQTNFTFVSNGIVTNTSETGALVQLAVTNSQFNPGPTTSGTGIRLGTQIGGVQILNNFFVIGGPGQVGVYIPLPDHCQVAFNQIQGIGSSSAFGVTIGPPVSAAPCSVSHNDIFGFGSGGLGIWTQTSSTNVLVDGNLFSGNTTNTLDQGSGNHYINNF